MPDFTTQSFLPRYWAADPPGDIATGYKGEVKTLRAGMANGAWSAAIFLCCAPAWHALATGRSADGSLP